jgi:MFS family permease
MSRQRPPVAAEAPGWRSPTLRRATVALSIGQLASWGSLFYALTVAMPAIARDTGWSARRLSIALSVALLASGLLAPWASRVLHRRGGRAVMAVGPMLGAFALVLIVQSPWEVALPPAFVVLGAAMAMSLYEPAMAVLVALDPDRRRYTLSVLTAAGGLAATVYAPATALLVDRIGWRTAMTVIALVSGTMTSGLHWRYLPDGVRPGAAAVASVNGRSVAERLLRDASALEQTAHLATATGIAALLASRSIALSEAAAFLATMGVGKVGGRMIVGRHHGGDLARLSQRANIVQGVLLVIPLMTGARLLLVPTALLVGAASGATTVLRPLLAFDLGGADAFASVNAWVVRRSSVARAVGPALLACSASFVGWRIAWVATLGLFLLAAARYGRLATR